MQHSSCWHHCDITFTYQYSRVPSFRSNVIVHLARCILGDGLTSFDFMHAACNFTIDIGTLAQSSHHFCTLNYNFWAWFSLVKLQNVIPILQRRTIIRSVKYFFNWLTNIPWNSLLGSSCRPESGIIGLLMYWRWWRINCETAVLLILMGVCRKGDILQIYIILPLPWLRFEWCMATSKLYDISSKIEPIWEFIMK